MVTLKPGTPKWEMFGEISVKLGMVFFDFCYYLKRRGVKEINITSIIRQKENDSGIHQLGRAMDVSLKTISNDLVSDFVEYFNKKYPYDEFGKYETMVIHYGEGYNGDIGRHLHIQVKE